MSIKMQANLLVFLIINIAAVASKSWVGDTQTLVKWGVSQTSTPLKKTTTKIIMDVDAGVDDAFGIILAVRNAELYSGSPVIAITCVNGNTNLQNVKTNVLRTLHQLQREDIPVYIGANESLLITPPSDNFFGTDGFGDFAYDPSTLGSPKDEHAVLALIRLVNENPGEIVLLALGPLTNIALAIKLDPTFISKLKEMVILGGTVTGIGNVKPGIEFNSYIDPEAFSILLKASTYDKVTILPWDTVVRTNIDIEWRLELAKISIADIDFLNSAERIWTTTNLFWQYGDPMAVAAYIWPLTIDMISPYRTTAVTCGEARGGLLVDFYNAAQNVTTSNVKIITSINVPELKKNIEIIFKTSAALHNNMG